MTRDRVCRLFRWAGRLLEGAWRGAWRGAARRGDRGSATAELAVAFPVVVLLLLAGIGGIDAMLTKLRCLDSAREAARVSARGGSGEQAGRLAAPNGATVSVSVTGDSVRAVVRAKVRLLVPLLPALTVEGNAVAAVEPGSGQPGDGAP
jgi:Flp pilus assembly protein TadG